MIDSFINTIVRQSDYDSSKQTWDEWEFYRKFQQFVDTTKALVEKIDNRNNLDFVCAVSKSGLPIGSLVSLLLHKSLIMFSIGEYINVHGIPIIGFLDEELIANKKLILTDSHVHSGETIRLASKFIHNCGSHVPSVAVFADCRIGNKETYYPNDLQLISLFPKDKIEINLNNKVGEDRLKDLDFWMEERHYWAKDVDFRESLINNSDSKEFSAELIDNNHSKVVLNLLLNGSSRVKPWRLYVDADAFNESCKLTANTIKEFEIDTIIACSLGAVPLAVGIGYHLDNIKTMLFLGNRKKDYFTSILKNSHHVLLVDDIIMQGSLISCVLQQLELAEKTRAIVSVFDQNNFPVKRNIFNYLKSKNIKAYTLSNAFN